MSHTPLLPPNQRYDIIKEYIAEETFTQLAERCGCNRRTIYRDIKNMKRLGEWWDWLERAMLRYGRKTTVSDTAKFNKYADLYAKQFLVSKEQSTTELTGGITIKAWKLGDADTGNPG